MFKIAQRTLEILRHLFPPISGDRVIDRAYWAIVQQRDELARRKRMAARRKRMSAEAQGVTTPRRRDGADTVR
jgi:hypothetical protein